MWFGSDAMGIAEHWWLGQGRFSTVEGSTIMYSGKETGRRSAGVAKKGQTSNDLVPGFERMDQAGHCWCITTGDRSGKMAKNQQSHSSAEREYFTV